jgi:type VI secretion system protein ImpH
MASQIRGPSFDLKLNLLKEGYSFSFFQVIRLIRLFSRCDIPAEEEQTTKNEKIKIRPELSLAFPASDIARVEELPGDIPSFMVTATFMGLYGVSSPLPTFYTEDLFIEAAEDETVARDFIDIISHRLYLLFFSCLNKYSQFLQVVEERDFQNLERLFCLLGIGEKELRKEVPEAYGLIRYMGLFTQFPRSSLGLKTLLQDAFKGIPIEIIPCLLRWLKIPEDQRMYLGVSGVTLGEDSFLGEEIEDRMGAFRLQIGPVNQDQFHALLPGTKDFKRLSFLIKFYLTEPLEYDVDMTLTEGEIKTVCLGGPKWWRLGLDTWTFSGEYPGEIKANFYPQNN